MHLHGIQKSSLSLFCFINLRSAPLSGLTEGLPSCPQACRTESEQFGAWGAVFEPPEVKGTFCALRKGPESPKSFLDWGQGVGRGERKRDSKLLKAVGSQSFITLIAL